MWTPTPETLASTKTALSVAASLAATAVLLRSTVNDLIPDSVYNYFNSNFRNLSKRLSSHLTIIIEEHDGLTANQMFDAANVYVGSKQKSSAQRIKVHKPLKEEHLQVNIDKNQEFYDCYKGIKLKWVLVSMQNNNISLHNKRDSHNNASFHRVEVRHFELIFHKKHRDTVLGSYLRHVLHEAEEIREGKKTLKLHTIDYNGTDYWNSIVLNHPATFDTVAMEPEMKVQLLEDLCMFLDRKEYYKRVGKAWKRGYLLYGPPGTGKSSLIAAMANYLNFDIYDMDFREVQCNSDLRRLLIGMGSRSILVIEDIDCSVKLQNREVDNNGEDEDKVTLSGLLNFIDGLWSSCGDERIIIFTTNYKDRLDPALLRPGRMDMHIHMSYCSFSGFKILATNYLGIQNHPLFEDIEGLLHKVNVTPAEVAGELMKSDNTDSAVKGLINFLQCKQTGTTTP
ncbi:hypothetical protein Lal_00045474 [Lupinus albus]|uniref:Putative ATPase, AAA-type, core, AAA-type ATPase domain-containing protein n=1 Tax=Lupinus albus TaxID=3870 RepID=A0A6A4PEX1_LUPAL|nr:putative ATPase, AAA-type, core, AAA-type ATPase domain-containing protein [Lupinus albus]KAF1886244.1 hypothetical protein Lal_00045474 [Lupinus albus]